MDPGRGRPRAVWTQGGVDPGRCRPRAVWTQGGLDPGRSGPRAVWTQGGVDPGRCGPRAVWTQGGVDPGRCGLVNLVILEWCVRGGPAQVAMLCSENVSSWICMLSKLFKLMYF